MSKASIQTWLLALCLATMVAPAWAQRRVALVIGNSDYAHESKLSNPANDARLIARTLRGLGFTVEERLNLRQRDMALAITRFTRESAGADTALLYFAGHGMQPSNGGRNYLLPVDANIDNDDALDSDGIAADRVVEQMERNANPAKLRLVVLDACRNNPRAGRTRGTVRGLSRMSPADDYTLIAFSTNDQDVAQDGSGANSPYAEALNRHLARARELPLRRIFELTASDVRAATGQKQRPRTYGDLDSRVGLDGQVLASAAPDPLPRPAPLPVARAAQPGDELKDCDDCPTLVVLPTGSFRMGSPDTEAGRDADEGPVHEVRIGTRLAVGKFEVTRGEFARFAQASGYKTEAEKAQGCAVWNGAKFEYDVSRHWRSPGFQQDDSHPVVCVSWNDTREYLKWLNGKQPGKGYRLLSEAEWEFAARAGQGGNRFPWGDDAGASTQCGFANGADGTAKAQVSNASNWTVANCSDGHAYTAAGDAFKSNAFGLHHMHGNAREWVEDVWHDNYDGAPGDGLAWAEGGDQARRVIRGGSWSGVPRSLRSADRFRGALDYRSIYTGFRIGRTL